MELARRAHLGETQNYPLPGAGQALVTGFSTLNILTHFNLSPTLSLFPTVKMKKQTRQAELPVSVISSPGNKCQESNPPLTGCGVSFHLNDTLVPSGPGHCSPGPELAFIQHLLLHLWFQQEGPGTPEIQL